MCDRGKANNRDDCPRYLSKRNLRLFSLSERRRSILLLFDVYKKYITIDLTAGGLNRTGHFPRSHLQVRTLYSGNFLPRGRVSNADYPEKIQNVYHPGWRPSATVAIQSADKSIIVRVKVCRITKRAHILKFTKL